MLLYARRTDYTSLYYDPSTENFKEISWQEAYDKLYSLADANFSRNEEAKGHLAKIEKHPMEYIETTGGYFFYWDGCE